MRTEDQPSWEQETSGTVAGRNASGALLERSAEQAASGSLRNEDGPARQDPAIRATREFFDFLLPAPRDFTVRLWDGSEFGGEDGNRYSIVLSGPGTARRMFNLPMELALGEALIFGDYDLQGDFFAAFGLKDRARAALSSPGRILKMLLLRSRLPSGGDARGGRQRVRLSGDLHSRSRDEAAIQYHYDVGNDFYALFLDERMVYTCAYFPTGTEDLATAQALKLEHICRKLRLKEGERLLDIGCGWGGFSIYAAQKFGVRVTGVTLSRRQFEFTTARVAEMGLQHLVEIRLQDYRDVPETFDKIASIGMFEAVGPAFTEYFHHAYRLLKPGGLFLNHSIASSPRPHAHAWIKHSAIGGFFQKNILGTGLIRERYIFPDGKLIPVSEANLIAEKEGLEVRDLESLREHYVLTLRDWLRRLEGNREQAVEVADESVYRTWRLYLTAAAIELDKGTININQTLFERPLPGFRGVPATRADLYA